MGKGACREEEGASVLRFDPGCVVSPTGPPPAMEQGCLRALVLHVQSALEERHSQALPDSSLSSPSRLKIHPFCQKEAYANSYIQASENT